MKKLSSVLSQHCHEILYELVQCGKEFFILCPLNCVSFSPELPEEIGNKLSQITMFVVSGFTLDSVELGRSGISFEAGFGQDNIASVVFVEYKHVLQISARFHEPNESILFVNIFSLDGVNPADDEEELNQHELVRSSREAILSNPKNKMH